MRLTVRPITMWPGKLRTTSERKHDPFKVNWNRCLQDLEREVGHLSGREAYAVCEMACTEGDIRLDGWIYADARLQHPGVILNIESKSGPLRLWTDAFHDFRGNVRAIGLYLQHQRAAERYGLGRGDEAFMGWKAIGASSIELGPVQMSYERAVDMISNLSGKTVDAVMRRPNACFRIAAQVVHPDADGGSEERFKQLVAARDVIFKHTEATNG